MNRELLYFTLALAAVYLLFDQFIGNQNLSRLSDKLWNNNMKEPEPKAIFTFSTTILPLQVSIL